MTRRGIVLAGGGGTRLLPMTRAVGKQLLPIYDKPMICYPLATLMQAGIREILVIATPHDRRRFERLLGDGSDLGAHFAYAEQPEPRGIADAFRIGETFIGGGPVALALGDNLFDGAALAPAVARAMAVAEGATIFGSRVADPHQYGVVELDAAGAVRSLEEKPAAPRSAFAVPGLYFYDGSVVGVAAALQPSPRGELEITDVNCAYLRRGALRAELFGPDVVWLDMGTPDALLRAANHVAAAVGAGRQIGSIEEAAFRNGWIDADQLGRLAGRLAGTAYGAYLQRLASRVDA